MGEGLVVSPSLSLITDQGNTNIKGNIASTNGNINITSANNTNIEAAKSTLSSSTNQHLQQPNYRISAIMMSFIKDLRWVK
jgi:predicted outer membrane protein